MKPIRFNLTKKIRDRDPVIQEIYDWLIDHVGPANGTPMLAAGLDYNGQGWKVSIVPLAHGKFRPQYLLSFDDNNHALLFKLRWSSSI